MFTRFWFILLICFIFNLVTIAQSESVLIVGEDGDYTTITAALEAANDGDQIEVHGGTYTNTPLEITKSVTLTGINQPVIDGSGDGTTVIITADDVVFSGFTIRNTGHNISHEDSGIIIQSDNVLIENNTLEDVLFGIYFADANHGIARGNSVVGYDNLDLAVRGDGIRVWFSEDVLLEQNSVTQTRDTLIWYANDITIRDNEFIGNRYGMHFMYSDNATVTDNLVTKNSVGTYLMYSIGLVLTGNNLSHNRGPSGYGIALKDMDEVVVESNWLMDNAAGIYIDNSPSRYEGLNYYDNNVLAFNDVGVSVQPNVERNSFGGNTFYDNVQQAGTRGRGNLNKNVWTTDGQGNYWNDYVGYDSDGDGVGDVEYRAEKLFESLADEYPVLKLFSFSPSEQAINFAASAFPTFRPEPKLVDTAPLIQYQLPTITDNDTPDQSLMLLFASVAILLIGGVVLWVGNRFAKDRTTIRQSFELQR